MAKVIGIHQLDLKPGATDDQISEVIAQANREMRIPGITTVIAKGDRGARTGQYVLIVEIESVETRDSYFPGGAQPSEAYNRHVAPHAALAEAFDKLFVFPDPNFTDYITVGE